MNRSPIEWLRGADGSMGYTWNPAIGCLRASPGCGGGIKGPEGEAGGCYAERLAAVRFSKNPKLPMWHGLARLTEKGDPRWTGEARFLPERLDEPLRVRKPGRVFVCDMGDLFYERFTNEQIGAVFGVMAACSRHTFLVLTKRADRLPDWFAWAGKLTRYAGMESDPAEVCQCIGVDRFGLPGRQLVDAPWPLPNVHLGVSAENQEWFDKRWPLLKSVPAAVHWVSYEPALGPIARGIEEPDWVVVGGESGPGSRPFDVDWMRGAVKARTAAKRATFCKQLGSFPIHSGCTSPGEHWPQGVTMTDLHALNLPWRVGLKDNKGADPAEWPEDLRVRQYPGAT